MLFDECPYCEGSGERDFLSGAKCYERDGKGYLEDANLDDDEYDDDYMSPEQQKQNDAMERGDYLRDRAKDERRRNDE
jgi:hypothetical protein